MRFVSVADFRGRVFVYLAKARKRKEPALVTHHGYRRTPVSSKYLVVAYRELGRTDGFVITAYFARRMATWRRQLWKR